MILRFASRCLPASAFSSRAVKANASWPPRSFTTSFPTALPRIAPCCAAFLRDRMPNLSGNSPTTRSSASCAMNCIRFSAFAPSLSLPASTNGSLRWRSTGSAILIVSIESSVCAENIPALPSQAMATVASECRIASAPGATPPDKSLILRDRWLGNAFGAHFCRRNQLCCETTKFSITQECQPCFDFAPAATAPQPAGSHRR